MTNSKAEVFEASQTERRGHERTIAPTFKIRCDGQIYVPDDWSLGGCRISGYKGDLLPGTVILIEVFLNVVHEHDALPVRAEVVRREPENDNALALEFLDLSADDILAYCDMIEVDMKS